MNDMYYKEFDIKTITSLVPDFDLDPEDIELGYVTLSFDTVGDMEKFERDTQVKYHYSLESGYDPLTLSIKELIHYNYILGEDIEGGAPLGEVGDDLFHIGNNFHTNKLGWDYLNK